MGNSPQMAPTPLTRDRSPDQNAVTHSLRAAGSQMALTGLLNATSNPLANLLLTGAYKVINPSKEETNLFESIRNMFSISPGIANQSFSEAVLATSAKKIFGVMQRFEGEVQGLIIKNARKLVMESQTTNSVE